MTNPPYYSAKTANPPVARGKTPILRWSLALMFATLAMLLYIGLQRDLRLRRYALDQARWHAEVLAERLGEGKTLPLNLEPKVSSDQAVRMLPFVWLEREEARTLRTSHDRIIAAYTQPLRRVLARDGCAVIFYHDGRFVADWLPLGEFNDLIKTQREYIRRLAP